jgi:REP element-mobilizing transposase RayT
VHVTVRMLPHVWNLRSRRAFRVLRGALTAGSARFGLRLCEFSIQGNHLHLVVEANGTRALSRGMQGLSIRLARGLNGLMGRSGKVLADRFHARTLRSPTEAARALAYVRGNHDVHRRRRGEAPMHASDPYSSASTEHGVMLPRAVTYFLRRAGRELEGAA